MTAAQMTQKAVILSGGLGSRLQPFTAAIPKPLLPVGEKAVLEIQIERLVRSGFGEIYLATNYKSGYIERFLGDGREYGCKLTVSKEEKPLGTAGPLSLLRDELTEPFLVMNGDVLSLVDLSEMYAFACSVDAPFVAGIKKQITPFSFGNIFFEGDYVTKVEEKPDFVTYALAGIYVLKPEILPLIPDDECFGIDQLILKAMELEMPVAKYEINEYSPYGERDGCRHACTAWGYCVPSVCSHSFPT